MRPKTICIPSSKEGFRRNRCPVPTLATSGVVPEIDISREREDEHSQCRCQENYEPKGAEAQPRSYLYLFAHLSIFSYPKVGNAAATPIPFTKRD